MYLFIIPYHDTHGQIALLSVKKNCINILLHTFVI